MIANILLVFKTLKPITLTWVYGIEKTMCTSDKR